MGIAAFLLKYRLTPRYQRSDALADGKRAIRYVRQNAKEFGISAKRVGIIGFSAGGHLASCTGIDFDDGNAQATDPVERQSSRPDFMVLVYGSTTTVSDPMKKDAPGKTFTSKTPPAFLFSTDGDGATDGLLACYTALRKVRVPAQLHVFGGYGPHRTGLGAGDPAIGAWPKLLHAWLRKTGRIGSRFGNSPWNNLGTPTLEFTKSSKDAKAEMRYEVKPGENQLKVEIRTK